MLIPVIIIIKKKYVKRGRCRKKNNIAAAHSTYSVADENNCVMMNENDLTIDRETETVYIIYTCNACTYIYIYAYNIIYNTIGARQLPGLYYFIHTYIYIIYIQYNNIIYCVCSCRRDLCALAYRA